MKRLLNVLALGLLVLAAACTTSVTRTAEQNPARPAAGTVVLVMNPDVELSLLTAAGIAEPKSDWNDQARANLGASLKSAMAGRQHQFVEVDPNRINSGRAGQILRLHTRVAQSILLHDYMGIRLANRPVERSRQRFDWTVGSGARALAEAGNDGKGDYALTIIARGSYSSGGRWAMAVLAAAGGYSVPMGGQQVMASLVELSTGRIVWFNVATAGPAADMRTPQGAEALVRDVLKDVPL